MRKVDCTMIGQDEQDMIVTSSGMNKAEKMRAMFEGGMDIKEISAALEIRYNHVYNTIQNYVIVNDIPVEKGVRSVNAKRLVVEALLRDGKTLMEAARETKTSYNYIWKISQDLKQAEAEYVTEATNEETNEEQADETEATTEAKPTKKKGRK